MSEPVAAIDIGTNSVLLLIAALEAGALRPLRDEATITRLGQGVDRTRQLAPEAIERTAACLEGYAALIRQAGVARVAAVATSAMRDAGGGGVFLDRAEAILGVRPEVISGAREAALTFEGAIGGLGHAGVVAVFDVGGGSTEIIVGEAPGGRVRAAVSLDVGAVRLCERHLRSDPPAPAERDALRDDLRAALDGAPALEGLPLVGVAGTVTTLAAIERAHRGREGAMHGTTLGAAQVRALCERLAGMSLEARRRLPGLDPKRADVIVAGAHIVEAIRARAGAASLTVSDRGVRWGLAARLAGSAAPSRSV